MGGAEGETPSRNLLEPAPILDAQASGEPRLALTYAALGAALGLGGPAGALLLRVLGGASLFPELRDHTFFYVYDLVGTCVVFMLAGFFAGRRADRLQSGRDWYEQLAAHDSLTSLANAQTFRRHYDRAIEHAARFREPISLLLIDVDQLKALNDSLGHSFGSASLLHVGRVLDEAKRVADVAARWGGDEFTLLMPGADGDVARRRAEDILARLRAEPVRIDGRVKTISATIGVATSYGDAREDLFEVADRALYAGKKAGRGKVRSARA